MHLAPKHLLLRHKEITSDVLLRYDEGIDDGARDQTEEEKVADDDDEDEVEGTAQAGVSLWSQINATDVDRTQHHVRPHLQRGHLEQRQHCTEDVIEVRDVGVLPRHLRSRAVGLSE